MAKSFRHFRALMRKNFILWYRTPFCAVFEILAPVVLMIALVVMRSYVPTSSTDQAGMLKKKLPSYPGVPNINGTWWGST